MINASKLTYKCEYRKDMEHYDQADVAFGGRFGRNFLLVFLAA